MVSLPDIPIKSSIPRFNEYPHAYDRQYGRRCGFCMLEEYLSSKTPLFLYSLEILLGIIRKNKTNPMISHKLKTQNPEINMFSSWGYYARVSEPEVISIVLLAIEKGGRNVLRKIIQNFHISDFWEPRDMDYRVKTLRT